MTMPPRPKIIGVDYGKGGDWSAEVEGYIDSDGRLCIEHIRRWRETIDLKANNAVITTTGRETK